MMAIQSTLLVNDITIYLVTKATNLGDILETCLCLPHIQNHAISIFKM